MIRQGISNSIKSFAVKWFKNEPYLIINMFLAGIILVIMIYSGIFSPAENNYPVSCIHEQLTGQQCVSCGLSHSFSLIIRGNINEAAMWNPYGLRVFVFFVSQMILRVVFSIYYLKYPLSRKRLLIIDSAGSVTMLLLAFAPFIKWIADGIFM